ncbi:DUF2283 domain-containing protein [Nonomuraea sp. NPDC046570]|uniref:DUF2283 domain-containing protein n=1 Tax=Nonomuraea sp. NPDC046570 TaxID=3155255 RepID=UPI0033C0A844
MYEIAQRVLPMDAEPHEVIVTIGLPYEEPTGEWSCPYRIDGLDGWEHERKVTGPDSLLALELALVMVRSAVAGSHEARRGLLAWDEYRPSRVPRTVYVTRYGDSAYISLTREAVPGEAERQQQVADIVLDFGESGELVGLELLDAATLMPAELRG